MDRRLGRRNEVGFEVCLRTPDGRISEGFARNIAAEGLFVQTRARILCGNCVDVHTSVCRSGRQQPVCFQGFVVHRTPEGIGILFRALDDEGLRVWRMLREGDFGEVR